MSMRSFVQAPTTTNVTLDGTVATATVYFKGDKLRRAAILLPDILRVCSGDQRNPNSSLVQPKPLAA